MQHIRGKVLLQKSPTIMTEGARERRAQDTLVLNLLSDVNIATSVLSFPSSQIGVRVVTKMTLKTLDKQHMSTTALFRLLSLQSTFTSQRNTLW